MVDAFLKHLAQTIALLMGMILFIYFLITWTTDRPQGIPLLIVLGVQWVAKVILVCVTLFIAGYLGFKLLEYYLAQRKLTKEKLEFDKNQILAKQKEVLQQVIEQARKEQLKLDAKIKKELELKNQRLKQIENDHYLKSRSAEESNSDALKHFL